MGNERVMAIINPAMLAHARKTSGLELDDVARKIRVNPKRVISWENGEHRPTINQLRKLADMYDFGLSFFYLPHVPDEKRKRGANHEMIRWVRESIGMSVEEAAERIGITVERLRAIEIGEWTPPRSMLETMSRQYGRNILFFYLSHPPADGKKEELTVIDALRLSVQVLQANNEIMQVLTGHIEALIRDD